MPASEQMVMQVQNGLTSVSTTVDDDTETLFRDPLLRRELRGHPKNLAYQRSIARLEIQKGRDMFSRYDENMNRRLGTDVLKSDDGIVLVN